MAIVKINLHKLSAERNVSAKSNQVKINNNVSIKNVENMDFGVEGKKGLRFTFGFNCQYEPELGKIEVEGQVLYVEAGEKVDEIKTNWDATKKIPREVTEQIINAALHKGNIQAIKVSEEVNLPSPLPLPKVKPQDAAGQSE